MTKRILYLAEKRGLSLGGGDGFFRNKEKPPIPDE